MIVAFAAAFGLLLATAILFVRLTAGPSLHDRILAAQAAAIVAALTVAAIAIAIGESAWADAAIVLALCIFVTAMAALKFLRLRSLQTPLTSPGNGAAS